MNTTLSSPHLPVRPTVGGLMRRVLMALLPGIAAMVICFGIGVISNLLIAVAAALATEAAMLRLRRRPVQRFLLDWTAVLTAVLFALALPPLAPWWLTATGSALAIVLGKQLYGGLGQNPFNPAMVGYVVVLISFPTELTYWSQQAVAAGTTLQAQWLGLGAEQLDGLTGATPLDALRSGLSQDLLVDEALAGLPGRTGWLWINLAFLAGGLWLCWRRDISWRIPAAVLAGLGLMALLPWLLDADRFASPLFHWTSGAAMLGAFFIATDPVSGATTPRGKLIFGVGIGLLVYVIRTWGGYPDGMAFAVLLMNLTVPLLDAHTQPRVYGRP
ncbi:RnfABCDGE type electron transport complex subunit D [Abyssibacter profundi]|uniref:Ion-translocating oxidoreductase complex subunit D n=1 Tax=Abyssibacter profundi TaxID=2182787 RepID=A0A363UQ96_9GAMM|nr:RnfABCDGE type electron transport complex subunit D [Abyssibacter profundi]PWN57606.1 electron transport complex subunit RsxD [Abyssibacter profundi]